MKSRKAQLDIFKLILIISVIIIHSNTYLHIKIEKTILFVYFIQLAVPMFMVLSGYTFSLAYSRTKSIKAYYDPKRIIAKIARFSVPMVMAAIVYMMARVAAKQTEDMIIPAITFNFGPGSYYFMLIIELILIFPLVYRVVERWGSYGVIVCIAINLSSEMLCRIVNLSSYFYARNILEYFAYIGFGCWIFRIQKTKKVSIWVYVCSLVIGLSWITVTQYQLINKSLFSRNLAYGLPVAFYVWIIVKGVSCIKISENNKVLKGIAELGKASFHILCTQMIWFTSLSTIREKLPFILPSVYFMPISILVCVPFGYAFYKLDTVVQNKVVMVFK